MVGGNIGDVSGIYTSIPVIDYTNVLVRIAEALERLAPAPDVDAAGNVEQHAQPATPETPAQQAVG